MDEENLIEGYNLRDRVPDDEDYDPLEDHECAQYNHSDNKSSCEDNDYHYVECILLGKKGCATRHATQRFKETVSILFTPPAQPF